MNIIIYGTGYVGLSLCRVLSNSHYVTGIDVDVNKVELLNRQYSSNHLTFETCVNENTFKNASVIYITVGTPSNDDGSTNLHYLFEVANDIVECVNKWNVSNDLLIILKSTIPCGTTLKFESYITDRVCSNKLHFAFNPEFLREGNEIYDLMNPDRIVIGCTDSDKDYILSVFNNLWSNYFKGVKVITTNYNTAEMIKYASNSFLALKISYINELSELCSKIGADIIKVAEGVGSDNRIGNKFLNSGLGWGGSCFPKDCHSLLYEGNKVGCSMSILNSCISVNEMCLNRVVEILENKFGDLKDKEFAIFGIAFKPGTDDIRDSVSLNLCHKLLEKKCKLKVHDPIALNNLNSKEGIVKCSDIQECVKDVDAIIIATEWDCYRDLNYEMLGESMRNKIIFDGRHLLYGNVPSGFEYLHL